MLTFETPDAASEWCLSERGGLGFVPTMGALHEGHLALVRRAARENERVCVSIFVNPLQFDDPQDLARYPRDFASDVELLATAGAHAAFTGTLAQFFPESEGAPILLDPGAPAAGLEGAHRQGHFAGVATIVDRLFTLVQPARAYFGAKDFQQTLVVRELARRRGHPEIVVGETVRETDGLALSSRNAQLSPAARQVAVGLARALGAAHGAWTRGERDPQRLAEELHAALAAAGVEQVEYAQVRDPEDWTAEQPLGELPRAQALIAAHVGGVRLIDNLRLDHPLPLELRGAAARGERS